MGHAKKRGTYEERVVQSKKNIKSYEQFLEAKEKGECRVDCKELKLKEILINEVNIFKRLILNSVVIRKHLR